MTALIDRLRARLAAWPARRVLFVVLLLGATGTTYWSTRPARGPAPVPRLTLVLPDVAGTDPVATQVRIWQDAAQELGYVLDTLTGSQLMRGAPPPQGLALILPDTLHRTMSDALVTTLRERVRAGDTLMLVHDAGIHDVDGRPRPDRARLSDLAGVDYGLHGELGAGMVRETEVTVQPGQIGPLQIPPGLLVRGSADQPHTRALPAPEPEEPLTLAGGESGRRRHASFVTRGRHDGIRLMSAPDGSLVAGWRRAGAGQVLFVNLPLTALRSRADGLLLHVFLRHYADRVAGLAQFSPVPGGVGAVVMNWHVGERQALPALQRAAALGAFRLGPQSVHVTAGPDLDTVGDGRGVDLAANADAQAWVRQLARDGHEIGSHGGWIRQWFATRVDRLDREVAAALIERNAALVSQFSGRPVREYSAPGGHHPGWVTGWLRQRDVRACQACGDSGMAPTRSYRDGQRPVPDLWSYPGLPLGRHAALDASLAGRVTEPEVAAWLADIDDFCADHRTLRLVALDPVALMAYPQALQQWLGHARALIDAGRLRLTTMAAQSEFANRRLRVRWSLDEPRDGTRQSAQQLQAHHPQSLDGMTWLLPRRRYGLPIVISGQARVEQDGDAWRIVAGAGTGLRVHLPIDHPGSAMAPAPPP